MASYKNGSITLENVYGKKTYETTIAECGSSIELQELTITQNGTYTAPEGTAYSPVNVNVPSKEEETKSITITENGKTTVLPTSGKVLSKVDIVANVPQTAESGTVKNLLDATKSCYYLFNNFNGTSIDGLISYNDTSNVTTMSHMFDHCNNLTTIPQLDTSKVTNMYQMFYQCTSLTTIPQLDTSKVTNMEQMFYYCSNLTTIPQLDTSKVTSMRSMFDNCTKLTTIPQLDTSKVTDMYSMFNYCSNLTTIPQLDTSSCTNMGSMFFGCSSLTTILQLDINKVTSSSFMFRYCSSLTYLKLLNIKVDLQIGSATYYGDLIEKDCLIQIISELIKPSSGTRTLTMGTINTAKLADTYVKLLNDDGTGKYPFEVCASTDEGAMTIEAYCTYKSWKLA